MKKYILLSCLLSTLHFAAQAQCTGIWGQPLVNQTFGQGTATDNWYGPLATFAPGATTSTTFVGAAGPAGGVLSDGFSGLAKSPAASGQGNWVTNTDHTGDPFGLLFLINAPSTAATVFFEYTMDNLCANTTLKLSVWMLNANVSSLTTNPTYQYPNMTLQAVDPVTNAVLGTAASGNVPADATWHQYSIVFNNGASTSVKLKLVNNSVGSGFGNDLAIDDITVQPCIPISHVLPKIDTLICQNASLQFNASVIASPYNPAEYQWQSSADGGVTWTNEGAASANTNYTFTTNSLPAGSYMIRYITGPQGATGNSNCIAISDTSTVTISAPPVVPVINYTQHYCTGTPFVPFTIVSGTNIKWYDTIGGTFSTTAPVINTNTPGSYTWYVSQTTLQGCESGTTTVHVEVHQTPEADFSFNIAPACTQDTVRFVNTTQNGVSYLWRFGDGSQPDTITSPLHLYDDQNTYSVTLIATNQSCVDSVSKPVVINHPLQAAFTTSADTICEGGAVTFTNTSTATIIRGTAPVYHWNFGDGATSSAESPAHNYSTPGIYHTMLVAGNGIPCYDTVYRDIYVDSMPQLTFTSSDTSVCKGQQVLFEGTYIENGLQSVHWNYGDTPDRIPGSSNASHAYDEAGTYTITLFTDYRVCPDQSASTQIRVKPLPVINLGPDTSICLDAAALTLSDYLNSGNPGATWLWSNGSRASSIQVKHDGHYTATVTIEQCSTSDEVVVSKDCNIDVPNSFTPNGDGVNDYFFPRQFLSSGVAGFTMTVFNRWGQKMFETQSPSGRGWDGKFNEKDQPVGVYIYSIKVVMKNLRTEEYTGNVTLLR